MSYFIGIAKTAHIMYAKKFMAVHDFVSRGDHIAVSTSIQGVCVCTVCVCVLHFW